MAEHPSPQDADWPQGTIFTVGHSTLAIERFIRLLQTYSIGRLVDIRIIPRSRHNPQFNDTVLASSLVAAHLEYVHCPALGGLRHPSRTSRNTGWRNKSFRGYADYMQTDQFAAALQALVGMSHQGPLPGSAQPSQQERALNKPPAAWPELHNQPKWGD